MIQTVKNTVETRVRLSGADHVTNSRERTMNDVNLCANRHSITETRSIASLRMPVNFRTVPQ